MCGRFGFEQLDLFTPAFLAPFLIDDVDAAVPETLPSRPNIAPTDSVLAILSRRGAGGLRRRLEMHYWTLVPPWELTRKLTYSTFNARVETVATSSVFRGLWKHGQRCLLPADRFYEWEKEPSLPGKRKQCYRLQMTGGAAFAFGAIWSDWRDPAAGANAPLAGTCAILTTRPNEVLATFHHRSPVIIPVDAYAMWLDPATPLLELAPLLEPYSAEAMTATPIDGPPGATRSTRRGGG